MDRFKQQQGFLTIAQNTTVDYLNLAYHQAKSIKQTQKINNYAVLVDQKTFEQVTDLHRTVFDYVILIENDQAENDLWKLRNEWQVFNLTPFKETIKLESDLVFTRSVDHWWTALRLKDVCLSYQCKNFQGQTVPKSRYRKLFYDNDLPDVYNGMMYFRYSQTAADFFRTARKIYEEWPTVTKNLLNCSDKEPTTDVVYSLTAKLLGKENFYVPSLDFFNFVHMKPQIQNWSDHQCWTDYVLVEQDNAMLRINNTNQYYPVHYYEKDLFNVQS